MVDFGVEGERRRLEGVFFGKGDDELELAALDVFVSSQRGSIK